MNTATPTAAATRKSGKTRRPHTTKAGRELIAALSEVRAAVLSGDPHRGMTVREVEIADPGAYRPADVKALRARLGVSVAVFARLVGVTPAQVEHWEQGRRVPAPIARRLLDHVAADPAGFLATLVRRRTP